MKRIFSLTLAVLLLLVLACQQVAAASLTLRAGTVEGAAGSTLDVPVEVVGSAGLGALQWELVYDPNVLTPDTVTKGAKAGNALVESRSDTPGRLFIALATTDDINGDGPVAVAHFKVTGSQGQTTNLAIENANAWDGKTHRAIQVNVQAGKFTVSGGLPWWLLLVALGIGLLLLLVALFMLLRQRQKPKAAAPAYPQGQAPPPTYPQGQAPPVYYAQPPVAWVQGQPTQLQPGPQVQRPYMTPAPPPPGPRQPVATGAPQVLQYPPRPPAPVPAPRPPQGSVVYCRYCGTPNAPGAPTCLNCHAPMA